MDNKYLETIKKNKETLIELGINYMIFDTECLTDLYSFQGKKRDEKAFNYQIENDDKKYIGLYKALQQNKLPMYAFNAKYDYTMLNGMCKFIENDTTNITSKLRRFNDYIIQGGLNYLEVNRDFWTQHYFKLQESTPKDILFDKAKESYFNYIEYNVEPKKVEVIKSFFNEFPEILGQSKVMKANNVIDIAKLLFLYSNRKEGQFLTTSLKKLQLFYEQKSVKFNFDKYILYEDIKKDGLDKFFNEYSLNDVEYLERLFLHDIAPMLITRYYACKAIQRYNSDFTFDVNGIEIHSESNTNLLNIFKKDYSKEHERLDTIYKMIDDGGNDIADIEEYKYEIEELENIINGNIDIIPDEEEMFFIEESENSDEIKELIKSGIVINYEQYIKQTGFKEFDRMVKFVNKNQKIKKDKELREKYSEHFEKIYKSKDKEDDKYEHELGETSHIASTIDTFDLFGTVTKIGFGGLHGALNNYYSKSNKLWVIDYEGLYPSIIKMFKEYFEKIMNTDLYLSLFKFRNTDVKVKLKELEEKINNAKDKKEFEELEEEKKLYNQLLKGVKLLLNSLYGLLNSTFTFSFANKPLGRFICLYGQYRAIELCKLIKKEVPESIIVNANTDGVYIDNITEEQIKRIIELDAKNGLKLEGKEIEEMWQFDVNNYMKFEKGELKTKGGNFKTTHKQQFARYAHKLSPNIVNALKYMENKTDIEILPIYFYHDRKKCSVLLKGEETCRDKTYYLTNSEKGKIGIKQVAIPEILQIDGEIMYFTENKEDADIKEYIKFARITQEKMKNFTLNNNNKMYYVEKPLSLIDDKEQISIRNKAKLKLNKLFNRHIVMVDKDKNLLSDVNITPSDIKPVSAENYSCYGLKEIMSSKEFEGYALKNNGDFYIKVTNNLEEIEQMINKEMVCVKHIPTGYYIFIFDNPFACLNIELECEIDKIYKIWDEKGSFKIIEREEKNYD